ncbi:hypothetical protein ACQCSX_03780 [Pseudarthrobacter sp. P1]|uniref:hypothetical protein n=1 Tax=Pseudarthrobacter sp. P1 TaxID=3418418 RepID=UPI003CE8CF37
MVSLAEIDEIALNGGIVLSPDGETIGSVEQIFTSEDSGEPVFVTVRTGLFGMSESFVPLAGSSIDGTRITVSYAKALVKNGPRIESDRGTITTAEERVLFEYFGLATAEPAAAESTPASGQAESEEAGRAQEHPDHHGPGHHCGGPPLPPHLGGPPPPHLLKHVPAPRPGSAPPPPPPPHRPRPKPPQ